LNTRSVARLLLKAGVLFVISVILVAGFWNHEMFYQFGLYSLLLLGGFTTLGIIVAGQMIFSRGFPKKRSIGTLGLTLEEGQHVLLRSATMLALPCEAAQELKPGKVVTAKYSHGSHALAHLKIRGSYRKILSDFSEEEIYALGYPSLEKFKAAIGRHGRWNPNDIVALTIFKVVEEDA
jgi:hypothetical protein